MFPVLRWGSLWLFCCRKSLSFSQTVSFSSPPFCNLVTQIDVPWRERFKVSDQCNLGCQTWSLHLHLLGPKSHLRLCAVFVFFVRHFVCSCSATPPICHLFLVAKFRNHKKPICHSHLCLHSDEQKQATSASHAIWRCLFFPFSPESEVTTQLTEENMRHSCFFQEFSRAGEIC